MPRAKTGMKKHSRNQKLIGRCSASHAVSFPRGNELQMLRRSAGL